MSSWKKYGGLDNFDKSNHITVNSIVADYFTVKKQFVGDFDVCGNLIARQQLLVDGSASIYGKLYTRSVDISGDLAVNNINCIYNASFTNINVSNDLNMKNNQFIHGDVSGIGINNRNPIATLDIAGNNVSSVNVYTSNNKNRNILANNYEHNGIALWCDDSSTGIDFFVTTDISINNTGFDGRIQYDIAGNLLLDAEKYVNIIPQLVISDLSSDIVYNDSIVTIHGDNSSNLFNYDSYRNNNAFVQNAITTVTMDNSSVMFVNFVKPNKTGFSIAGGNCPYDSTRIIGAFGFNDLSNHTFTANQTIVSGSSTVKYKTTTGINTYKPIVDKYVLDINGPVHIRNGENNIVARSRSVINCMQFNKVSRNIGIALSAVDGSNIAGYYTTNGGETWNIRKVNDLNEIQKTLYTSAILDIKTLFVYDSSYAFALGETFNGFYTYDGGRNWIYIQLGGDYTPKSLYICNAGTDSIRFFITSNRLIDAKDTLCFFDASINVSSDGNYFNGSLKEDRKGFVTYALDNSLNSSVIDGFGDYIYVAGNNGIRKYSIENTNGAPINAHVPSTIGNHSLPKTAKFNAISVFDDSYVVAVGDQILSYTRDGGANWTDFSEDYAYFHPQNYNFTSVNILDSSNAIAVGTNGKIAYTNDGITWFDAPISSVFGLSGSEKMLDGLLNNVTLLNKNAFVLTNTNSTNMDNSSNIVYNFFPDVFNHANNNVLDISGNMSIYGNINMISDRTNTISIASDATNCNFLTNVSNLSIGRQNSNATFNGDITVTGKIKAIALQFVSTAVSYLIIDSSNSESNGGAAALDVRNGGSANIDGSLGVYGNVVFFNNGQNAFRVEGSSVFRNTMTVSGESYFNNTITVSNPSKNVSTDGSANGALYVDGNAKINNNLYVMKKLYVDGSNNADSFQVNAGNINLTNNVYINGDNFYVTSDASFNGKLTINTSGKLVVNSDASFNGNVLFGISRIDNSGSLFMNAPSTFTDNLTVNTPGKLVVNSDASFNGSSFFGISRIDNSGSLFMNAPSTFTGNVTVNTPGKLVVNGDASFNGNILFGNSKIDNSGSLFMNAPSTFANNITVNTSGELIVNGDASFNGNILFGNSKIDDIGAVTLNNDITVGTDSNVQFNCNVALKTVTYNDDLVFTSLSENKLVVNSDASFNGNVYINTSYSNSSNILSDYRIKSNVRELGETGFSIDSLNPVVYNNNTGKEDIGFIAHELQQHFPFLVNGEKDGETLQSVNYNGLIGLLVRELQVLKKKVAQLENQNHV